jgi:hypothetical protein
VRAGCFKPDPIILGPLTGSSVSAEIQRKRRSETQPAELSHFDAEIAEQSEVAFAVSFRESGVTKAISAADGAELS